MVIYICEAKSKRLTSAQCTFFHLELTTAHDKERMEVEIYKTVCRESNPQIPERMADCAYMAMTVKSNEYLCVTLPKMLSMDINNKCLFC